MIKTIFGDATQPEREDFDGRIIIPHVVNDVGRWGSGFVMALSKRCRNPEEEYRSWCEGGATWDEGRPFILGQVQLAPYMGRDSKMFVANMIAQRAIYNYNFTNNKGYTAQLPPLRYGALEECMYRVGIEAQRCKTQIHCPKFGAGLAGGDWSRIYDMIQKIWGEWAGLDVTIYEYRG